MLVSRWCGSRLLLRLAFVGLLVAVPADPAWASGVGAGNGSLDPSFGDSGKVLTDVSGVGARDTATDLVVQPDGKIVAIGDVEALDFALARYDRRGRLDTSFGTGGTVRTDITGSGSADRATAAALQRDGKIVVAGTSGANGRFQFALVRYTPDGSLDTSFGTGGKVLTDFGTSGYDVAMAVAIQPDGKIVAAGRTSSTPTNVDFALARYAPDGSLDASFGTNGTVVTDIAGGDDQAEALALRPDGTIMVAGRSGIQGVTYDFALAQYDRRGRLDEDFGDGGIVLTDFSDDGTSYDIPTALVLRPDGSALVAGFSNVAGSSDFALASYDRHGQLEKHFGDCGIVLTDLSGHGSADTALAATLVGWGAVVVAGTSDAAGSNDFALASYDRHGRLDEDFGDDGIVLTDFSGQGSSDIALAVATAGHGRIVAAGTSDATGGGDFALARYLLR